MNQWSSVFYFHQNEYMLNQKNHKSSDGPFALIKVEAGLYGFLNQNFKPTRLGLYLTFDFSDLPKFRLKRK